MNPHILERTLFIPAPISTVFDFFKDAGNLQKLTPPHLHFDIITPTSQEVKQGMLIDYKLKLFGIPFYWKTLISDWNPPYRFVDEQLKGPYKKWRHTHSFKAVDGGTEMTDRVEYLSLGLWLEWIPHILFVKRQVEQIFDYRNEKIQEIFPS